MSIQKTNSNIPSQPFFQLPAFLFTDERYSGLSNDAKVLYALLRNRKNLSRKNNWQDDQGIFIKFSRQEMAAQLHCSRQKAANLIDDLATAGLVFEKRLGLNKTNLIYVLDEPCAAAESNDFPNEDMQAHPLPDEPGLPSAFDFEQSLTSGCYENEHPDVTHPNTSNIYSNNKYISNSAQSINQSYSNKNQKIIQQTDWIDHQAIDIGESDYRSAVFCIKRQIDYDTALKDPELLGFGRQIDQIVNFMADIYCSKREFIWISSQKINTLLIKCRLELIDRDCLGYILKSMHNQRANIRNMHAYLMTTLYNAPVTYEHWEQNQINIILEQNRQLNSPYLDELFDDAGSLDEPCILS